MGERHTDEKTDKETRDVRQPGRQIQRKADRHKEMEEKNQLNKET